MENNFSAENLYSLINVSMDDKESLDFIVKALKQFENYHRAIFEMETWRKIYDSNVLGLEEYQNTLKALDKQRSLCHNALLADISILNRMAEEAEIGLIYNGIVSEQKPYRRQVADSVLAYIESVILERN